MATQHDYTVDGFVFHNRKDAQRAQKEKEGVEYLLSKTDFSDEKKRLAIYLRLIDQDIFETPVGISFLRKLREDLLEYYDEDDIAPIDTHIYSEGKDNKSPGDKTVSSSSDMIQAQRDKKLLNISLEHEKSRFKISFIVNIVLIVMVIGMFIIASTSGSVTILNYENKIIDKYEEWENSLSQREKVIREYESKYGITQGDDAR